jgi:hypothetical protein
MVDKTPIRLVLDGSNNPTGIAEYQSGETIPVISGGTGLSSLGTAGFFLRTNEAGTALEYAQVNTTLQVVDDSSSIATINLLNDSLRVSGLSGITTSVSGDTIQIDLDNTSVSPGSYGSATEIPTFTVDQQGRLTAAGSASVATNLTIVDDSSTSATISLLSDTLKISGTSNEIETAISGDTVTIGLPNDVTISNDLTVTGNLTVNGTTTTISSTNTVIEDKLLELANGVTGSPSGDVGIIIERGDSDNVFIGWDESADEITFGTGTFTGATTGDLSLTNANIRAANITGTGNLDVSGSSTLRGNITLGVISGDSTEDSITVNARFVSNLEPLNTLEYDLGSPNRRWRDIYLSGNTIDLNGATISGDGSGQILISASGATLPVGSKVGTDTIASADSVTGVAVRNVFLFTKNGGLSTAAATFVFSAGSSGTVFQANQTFLLTNGATSNQFTLFQF